MHLFRIIKLIKLLFNQKVLFKLLNFLLVIWGLGIGDWAILNTQSPIPK